MFKIVSTLFHLQKKKKYRNALSETTLAETRTVESGERVNKNSRTPEDICMSNDPFSFYLAPVTLLTRWSAIHEICFSYFHSKLRGDLHSIWMRARCVVACSCIRLSRLEFLCWFVALVPYQMNPLFWVDLLILLPRIFEYIFLLFSTHKFHRIHFVLSYITPLPYKCYVD